jgi:hypothetical protein
MTDTAALLEVALTDADGNEHIYWVTRMPEAADAIAQRVEMQAGDRARPQ